jgi:hypothetical protein
MILRKDRGSRADGSRRRAQISNPYPLSSIVRSFAADPGGQRKGGKLR